MSSTASSKSSKLYDPVRRRRVANTPEERVRQALLYQMLSVLAFPRALIAVETHLKASGRRADILVHRVVQDALQPLLLVECKAERCDETALAQAIGYNTHLAAPFLCIAHAAGIRTFWREGSALQSVGFLPPYLQLVERVSS